jgi:hypothetical protein
MDISIINSARYLFTNTSWTVYENIISNQKRFGFDFLLKINEWLRTLNYNSELIIIYKHTPHPPRTVINRHRLATNFRRTFLKQVTQIINKFHKNLLCWWKFCWKLFPDSTQSPNKCRRFHGPPDRRSDFVYTIHQSERAF